MLYFWPSAQAQHFWQKCAKNIFSLSLLSPEVIGTDKQSQKSLAKCHVEAPRPEGTSTRWFLSLHGERSTQTLVKIQKTGIWTHDLSVPSPVFQLRTTDRTEKVSKLENQNCKMKMRKWKGQIWGLLTWPNKDDRMNMTEPWQRRTVWNRQTLAAVSPWPLKNSYVILIFRSYSLVHVGRCGKSMECSVLGNFSAQNTFF